MENFVLYDEVGRGNHSIVYKGRRKGTINFVAIHCIDKCKRPEITNLVRLTHELDHKNIVKFHEWYETSNHLWLVVELCTGGSLETVISQDDHLPESAIRNFGVDLVKGLHHIHSLGIVFSDLKPSKLLLDGPGVLKFAGFQYGRLENENLEELFEHFSDSDWNNSEINETIPDIPKKYRTMGSPSYMAPEVFKREEHTMISDLWSLGCVFFEMYTGHPPYLAENFNDLMDKILHKDFPPLKVKGARVSSKPSPEFQNLVESLLQKDPEERLGWHGLVTHSFWQGQLAHLVADLELNPEVQQSVRESLRRSMAGLLVSQTYNDLPKVNSVLGNVQGVTIDQMTTGREHNEGTNERPDSTAGGDCFRPRTAQGGNEASVAFTLSSRPCTAGTPVPDDLHPPQRTLTRSPTEVKDTVRKVKASEVIGDRTEVTQLIFHSTDFTISQIVDNPKISKPGSLKFDAKVLPVPALSGEKLSKLSSVDLEKHLKQLHDALSVSEKGPPSQKKVHLLYYIGTIAMTTEVANSLTAMGFLNTLVRLVKDVQQLEMKHKLSRAIGLIAFHTNEVAENIALNEVIGVLTEVLREHFRNGKLKQAILPALGEVLYLVASQEEVKGHSVESWGVQTMTYTLITRCIREGEDVVVNHYAAKVVENVATTKTPHAQKLAVNEVGLMLWYIFTHASADILKVTALSAMARLTKHNVSVFQTVIEKVGLPKILSTMQMQVPRIQQAIVTMFACLITSESSSARITRLIQDKDFIASVMRLLESPSAIIRAKAFLVILEVTKISADVLLGCCQNRLVMYIERDIRKQTLGKSEQLGHAQYLSQCLELLVSSIVDRLPSVTKDILGALEMVSGRKHPSTVQIKQLKAVLPHTPIVHHVITSQVFRPKVISTNFMKSLSQFLVHIKAIDSGTTSIQGATGPGGSEDFINTVFGIVEAIAQHAVILLEYHSIVIDQILRSLAQLVTSSSEDTRLHALRLFSEMAALFLNTAEFDPIKHKQDSQRLHQIISQMLLPQFEQILLEQDPVPSYGLRLLWALLDQNPSSIKQCQSLGLIPVIFQVLVDHIGSPISVTMQRVSGVLSCLIAHKETNMKELYDHGLVDHLVVIMTNVGAIYINNEGHDLKTTQSMVQVQLETLHMILKYVSDIVRKALQAKKVGNDEGNKATEMAEALLLKTKPLTQLLPTLTQLLIVEDQETGDIALKSLSLLVQLFGGEHPEALSKDNMQHYSDALKLADSKKQKVILRIIKRIITTEKSHAEAIAQNGDELITTIQSLCHTASSHAEVAIATLAADILKSIGKL